MIPRDTYDGAFYRAVLALHDDQFPLAQQCIEKARDILDTDLTAMAGESYNRAYGVRPTSAPTGYVLQPRLRVTYCNRAYGVRPTTAPTGYVLQPRFFGPWLSGFQFKHG